MASPSQEPPKRPLQVSSPRTAAPPAKRLCKSPSTTSLTNPKPLPSIQEIVHLPEDAIYSLAKADLRSYFLALQQYAQNPYTFPTCLPEPSPREAFAPDVLPKLLTLPVEIRELIYSHLLPPPKDHPVRGPHPRQLQNHLQLTQVFPPSILLVSRQIHDEALPIFYGAPSQVVYIKIDYNVWVHKTARSPLILSPAIKAAIRHLHISIYLGCEKRHNKPGDVEKEARLTEVSKGVKKARKWLADADIQTLVISWQEPSQTYTLEQKKDILEGLRPLQPKRVDAGEINWGLNWNKGRRYRFPVEYLKDLQRHVRDEESSDIK
ncbi:hypothetical protein BP5796_07304 [Coleophoma crateriformis]|uniref:Uncharacterized protein n=1 Tax=Coleophoma crateriformis TaxID=565419 RepID=A0A3D8RII4_9HELO|nr:hypothetical protein BP5796_07304 [Coleophoma crateriformis]